MEAFEREERAKGRVGRWWQQMSDSEDDAPTKPQWFRPSSRQEERPVEPAQAREPQRELPAERRREPARGNMNPNVNWDLLVHETRFTDDEPDVPMDSAGHDEVVYVGSVGGSPKAVSAAEVETQQALLAQEALLREAKEKRAKLVEALGEEEAARYMAFRQGETQREQHRRGHPDPLFTDGGLIR